MIDLRKRTKSEIDKSVKNKDYTGGYNWYSWLIYMRFWYLIGLIANLFIGWVGGFSAISSNPELFVGYLMLLIFGLVTPIIIVYFLRSDYKSLKNGRTF